MRKLVNEVITKTVESGYGAILIVEEEKKS